MSNTKYSCHGNSLNLVFLKGLSKCVRCKSENGYMKVDLEKEIRQGEKVGCDREWLWGKASNKKVYTSSLHFARIRI